MGTQLSREPWQLAVTQIFERLGQQLQPLGVPGEAQFDCAAALISYILGLAGQYAAVLRLQLQKSSRPAFQENVASQWAALDPAAYPFVHRIAAQFSGHDDRKQFLVGIQLFLTGLKAVNG